MYLRATLAAGLLIGLLAVAPAQAQTTNLPVRQADGVRLTPLADGTVRLTFTKKAARLYRKIAGRVVVIGCTTVERGYSGGEVLRAPKRRSSFVIAESDATQADYCEVRFDTDPAERPVVAVPLTQAGAVHLDERDTAVRILAVLAWPTDEDDSDSDSDAADYRIPTWAEFQAAVPANIRRALRVVELVAPGDTPPPGKVGYFSDGNQHAVVAAQTATGRRLFFEVLPGQEVRTNILSFLLNGYDD